MPEGDARSHVIERIKRERAFRSTAVTFALVIALLMVIWAVSGAGFFWPIFPIVGTGIALAFQAWGVFGERPITEDEIGREMDREAGGG